MRIWGKVPNTGNQTTWDEVGVLWSEANVTWSGNASGIQTVTKPYVWQEVTTDANGYNDAVYVTALIQVLKLQTGESPFYAQYGIPAQQSVTTQTFPDYSVYFIQQQYSRYFAALKITKLNQNNQYGVPEPVYQVSIITQQGSIINLSVPVPT